MKKMKTLTINGEKYQVSDPEILQRAPAIVCKAEGEVIKVSDASDDYIRGLRLFGKTTQLTTTGKNLIPYPYVNTTKNINGVVFTDNGDGSITANGTATSNAVFALLTTETYITLTNGTYIVSGGYSTDVYVQAKNVNTDTDLASSDGTDGSFTISEPTNVRVNVAVRSGASVSNFKFYPMIRLNSMDATYEPYTGGIPSPNPAYPQELVNAGGDNGEIVTDVYGANLLDPDKVLTNINTTVVNGVITQTKADSNNSPTFKCQTFNGNTLIKSNVATNRVTKVGRYGVEFEKTSEINRINFGLNGSAVDTTVRTDVSYLQNGTYYMSVDFTNVTQGTVSWKDMMISIDPNTSYEPYKRQSLTVSTPNGLPSIPVSSGGTYTDADGRQRVCDYKDYAWGVNVQILGEYVITGNETIGVSGNTARVLLPNEIIYKKASSIAMLCNRFKQYPRSFNTVDSANSTMVAGEFSHYFRSDNDTRAIYFKFDTAPTVDTAVAWFKANETRILFQLETPVETPLSAEEMAAFAKLHTNKPNTTVYNDSGVHMELAYSADTKTYIDKKFAELAAVILSKT